MSDNIDFHPTDVIEDADGSLLIVDTGGWYKLCCPTSQLVKPDVTGAIYRVKKVGAHKTRSEARTATLTATLRDRAEPRPGRTRRGRRRALSMRTCTRAGMAAAALRADRRPEGRPGDSHRPGEREKRPRPRPRPDLRAHRDRRREGGREGADARVAARPPGGLAALSNIPKASSTRRPFSGTRCADAALRETAWWIAGRHPQWGDQLAGYFQDKLKPPTS